MSGSRDVRRKSRKSRKSLRTRTRTADPIVERARALLEEVDPVAATQTLFAETGRHLSHVLSEEEVLGYVSYWAGDLDYDQAALLEDLAFTEAGAGGP